MKVALVKSKNNTQQKPMREDRQNLIQLPFTTSDRETGSFNP